MKTEKDSKVNPSSTKKHDALSALVRYLKTCCTLNNDKLEKKRNGGEERKARIR